MTNPWIVLVGIVVVALVYVVLPVVGDAFRRFRAARRVTCPEAGVAAEVGIDAPHAALTAAYRDPELRVRSCSLWPQRDGCAQRCIGEAEAESPEAHTPRATLGSLRPA